MGLDAIELIMETEATFDVEIPDETAGGLHTLGDLYLHVLRARGDAINVKYDPEHPTPLETVRTDLAALLGKDVETIRPDDELDAILPTKRRTKFWRPLTRKKGGGERLYYPDLRYPPKIGRAWATFCLILPAWTFVSFIFMLIGVDQTENGITPWVPTSWTTVNLIASLSLIVFLFILSKPLGYVARRCFTMRWPASDVTELSKLILALNSSYFMPCLRSGDEKPLNDDSEKRKTIDAAMFEAAWRRLHPALAETYDKPEYEIELSLKLEDLPQNNVWYETWDQLSEASGLKLPLLRLPAWFQWCSIMLLLSLLLAFMTIPGGCIIAVWAKSFLWLFVVFGGIAYFLILKYLLKGFQKITSSVQAKFPKDVETVGDLTRRAMQMNASLLFGEIDEKLAYELPDSEASLETDPIWIVLRHLIASHTGADETTLKPSMKFTDIGF